MMQRSPMRRLAALLCLMLTAALLSGCLPLLVLETLLEDDSPPPAVYTAAPQREEPAEADETPAPSSGGESKIRQQAALRFGDIVYSAPDAASIALSIEALRTELYAAASYAEARPLIARCEELFLDFDTTHTYASLMSEIQPYSARWESAFIEIDGDYGTVAGAKQDFMLAVLDAGYGAEVRADWPKYFLGWDTRPEPDGLDRLWDREAELEEELLEILEGSTIRYRGRAYTFWEIYDIEDYDAYEEAEAQWLRTYNGRMVEIYIELVGVRNEIARAKGFADYAEMTFELEGRDYTTEMAASLIASLEEHVFSLFDGIWEMGGYYAPDIDVDIGDFMNDARTILARLDPAMAEALDAMEATGFYYADEEGLGYVSPYVIYMDTYQMPFLMTVYENDMTGMTNFAHEFGHFYEMYTRRDEYAYMHDISEMHSQALELLFANHFEVVDDYWAGELLYDAALECVEALSTTAYLTALELEIYKMDGAALTVDGLNDLAYRKAIAFGNESYGEDYNRYGWIADDYLIYSPMREICYTTSMVAALEIWEISLTDEAAALAAYDRLINTPHIGFLDTVAYAGLDSPFNEGRIEALAEMIRAMFVDGELEVTEGYETGSLAVSHWAA